MEFCLFALENTFLNKKHPPLSKKSKHFKSFTVLPAEIHHAVCYINLCCAYTHLCHRQTHTSSTEPRVRKHTRTSDIYVHVMYTCAATHKLLTLVHTVCTNKVFSFSLTHKHKHTHTHTQVFHQVARVSVSALERDQCSLSSLSRPEISPFLH